MKDIRYRKQFYYLFSYIVLSCLISCNQTINSSFIHFGKGLNYKNTLIANSFLESYKIVKGYDYLSYSIYRENKNSNDRFLISSNSKIISIKGKNFLKIDTTYRITLYAIKLEDSLKKKIFPFQDKFSKIGYLAIEDKSNSEIKDILFCSTKYNLNDGLSHFKNCTKSFYLKDTITVIDKSKHISSDFGDYNRHQKWLINKTYWIIDKINHRFVKIEKNK